MAQSFFFYDLETSGFDPKYARIMQFAGQRTDPDLNPIGEPVNTLIRLTPDVLPDPDAVLVTGITPQATLADGITEAAFLEMFQRDIATPGTIFVGYNSVRFDDEFMRFTLYRNFYDAYEWEWSDQRSRWDILDVVRMTRALRPDGIIWPFATDGASTNQLSFITSVNGLDHESAHDALSDVGATIAVAKLIKTKQPKLFQYLLDMRDKKRVAELVNAVKPFVYTSGAYSGEFEKTTIVVKIADLPNGQGALVYDLRYNPADFSELTAKEIKQRMSWQPRGVERLPFPVKALRYNRCPAVAPLNVLDATTQTRLRLDVQQATAYQRTLADASDFIEHVRKIYESRSEEFSQSALVGNEQAADAQLYDGFLGDQDRKLLAKVRAASPDTLNEFQSKFADPRLQALLPLYKARNYPEALTRDERTAWEAFCSQRLFNGDQDSRLATYGARLQTLTTAAHVSQQQKYLLEELQLYAESIMPIAA